MSFTIHELKTRLAEVEDSPRVFFGTEIDSRLKELHVKGHPDHYSDPKEKEEAERIFKRLADLASACKIPALVIETERGTYTVEKDLGEGDVSKVYQAVNAAGDSFVVKVPKVPGTAKFFLHEEFTLRELIDAAKGDSYAWYFPQPIESVKSKSDPTNRINVFSMEPGFFTLEEIKTKYPSGLDGKHLAWIYKRLLTGLGFAHEKGWKHNATLPPHILICPATHGMQILDWKTATQKDPLRLISAKYRDWYPPEVGKKESTTASSDIYMATKCIVYLAGGDPVKGAIPDSVPRQMSGFFRAALLESQKQRPQNAWDFMDEFTEMLKSLYGKPQFHPLSMK